MKLYSTNRQSSLVTFREAFFLGQPADRGLFMPEQIPRFTHDDLDRWQGMSYQELAFEVSKLWIGDEISDDIIRNVVAAYTWDVPVREVDHHTFVLELWHGPTFAFKDFAAQWMGRMTSALSGGLPQTVLVATSGDTGSAVAAGFLHQPGVRVVILYPKGKVSTIQERQLTTFGGNVIACAVEGTFDDCQRMVKDVFADKDLRTRLNLISANSINIGRLLPQTIYYIWAYLQVLQQIGKEIVVSVPSGNLGNFTACVIARRMGLPLQCVIAATNRNDVFTEFLSAGRFIPRPSISTISNAMDVGNPSNIFRLFDLYSIDHAGLANDNVVDISAMRRELWSISVDDVVTQNRITRIYSENGYIIDPHTAVAWEALDQYRTHTTKPQIPSIVVSTAHPAKFITSVEEAIEPATVMLPRALRSILDIQGTFYSISTDLTSLIPLLLG